MNQILNRLLSKLHSIVKTAFFGIFFDKFFGHMFTYCRKIYQKICTKISHFSNQSMFRKKSHEKTLWFFKFIRFFFQKKGLFFFLLFFSCNLKPQYERPEVEMGDAYRFEPKNATEYANLKWWGTFQDPWLDNLIELALENNQDLQVATARVLEFEARYRVVFSQLFPQIGASLGDNRIKLSNNINFFRRPPTVPRINNLYSFFLNLSYEIDFWGKIRNATDAAKSIYLSEVHARQNVVLTLVSSVAASYILLKQYLKQLEISNLTYESRKKSWEIAILRFEGGIVSELEVKQAESEALVAEVQVKNFEILIAKQQDLLSLLIGEAPHEVYEGIALEDLSLPLNIPAGLPSDLLENRPDILEAEQKIMAANAQIGVARAAFFPSFSLTGSSGKLSTESKAFFDSASSSFNLGIQAFEPLFTGFRRTNQLKESEAFLMQALHGYQQTILNALKEVDDALIEHEKSQEKLFIQRERVQALKKYLELANLRYFNGQSDYLTVLDAEKSLFVAELSESVTIGDLYLSLISLYKALGQGWDVEKSEEISSSEEESENNSDSTDSSLKVTQEKPI